MKVKVGDTWHDTASGVPVLIHFTAEDFRNLAQMSIDGQTKYIRVPKDWTEQQVQDYCDSKTKVTRCKE